MRRGLAPSLPHYFGGLKSVPKMVKDTLTIKTDDGMIYTIMGLKADNYFKLHKIKIH